MQNQNRDDINTMNDAMLVKKLCHDVPNLYKYTALNKLKDFADNKELNNSLANNLSSARISAPVSAFNSVDLPTLV